MLQKPPLLSSSSWLLGRSRTGSEGEAEASRAPSVVCRAVDWVGTGPTFCIAGSPQWCVAALPRKGHASGNGHGPRDPVETGPWRCQPWSYQTQHTKFKEIGRLTNVSKEQEALENDSGNLEKNQQIKHSRREN